MNKIRKEFQIISIAMFILVGIELCNLISYIVEIVRMDFSTFDAAARNAMPMVNFLFMGLSVFAIAAYGLLALKGLKEAKAPTGDRYHIIIAQILFALSIIAFVTLFIELFSAANLLLAILETVLTALMPVALFTYVDKARKVRIAKTI